MRAASLRPAPGLAFGLAAGLALAAPIAGCREAGSDPSATPPRVEALSFTPDSLRLSPGVTARIAATPRDSAGQPVPRTAVAWSASDTAVVRVAAEPRDTSAAASVASVATVTGLRAGSSIVEARTPEDVTGHVRVSVGASPDSAPADSFPPSMQPGHGHFVAADVEDTGDGSFGRPWTLPTAFDQPGALQPGDTVWVRGGTYRGCFTSRLIGTSAAPIVVRAYPGERVTLDGARCTGSPTLIINGGYTWYWGLEVTNSAPVKDAPGAIYAYGREVRLINLVVHDAAGTGLGFWDAAVGGVVYGSLFYNNGSTDNLDHGIYAQNSLGTKRLLDNILFDNRAYGIHAYASSGGLRGFDIEGNTSFNNGTIGATGAAPNIMVGGETEAASITVVDNLTYHSRALSGNVWLGRSARNQDVTIERNYMVGGATVLRVWRWAQARVTDNVLYGADTMVSVFGSTQGFVWSGNVYGQSDQRLAWILSDLPMSFAQWRSATGVGAADQATGTRPTGVKVFVRPNRYEPGRANVTVYNWDRLASVSVDLSHVLEAGAAYEVRNAQDFYGAPVASGTYAGSPVSLPMAGVAPPAPRGGAATPPPATGPDFQVFVVLRR